MAPFMALLRSHFPRDAGVEALRGQARRRPELKFKIDVSLATWLGAARAASTVPEKQRQTTSSLVNAKHNVLINVLPASLLSFAHSTSSHGHILQPSNSIQSVINC